MQQSGQTFVGLDIGTSKIACAVGTLEAESYEPTILALSHVASNGVRKGSIVDIDDTATAIQTAVEDATRTSGVDITGATVSVGGTHLKSLVSKGVIAVGGLNRAITHDDVARVEEAATVVQLPPNREIIQVFTRHYRLDGQEYIKDPIGMNGVRLEADTHLITAATPAIRNLQKCVYQAGLTIHQQEAPGLAAARAVLDKRQREQGTMLVDIGAGTTNLVIFEEGEILHTATLGIGSAYITNDLAIGFRTDMDSAEIIKCKYTDLHMGNRHHGATIKSPNGESLTIDLAYAVTIARARWEEIFELVRHELDKAKRAGKLPGGAVLVGGGASQKGIVSLAKDILELPVSLGAVRGVSIVDDKIKKPTFAVAIGLMLDDMFLGSSDHRTKLSALTTSKLRGALGNLYHFLRP